MILFLFNVSFSKIDDYFVKNFNFFIFNEWKKGAEVKVERCYVIHNTQIKKGAEVNFFFKFFKIFLKQKSQKSKVKQKKKIFFKKLLKIFKSFLLEKHKKKSKKKWSKNVNLIFIDQTQFIFIKQTKINKFKKLNGIIDSRTQWNTNKLKTINTLKINGNIT